MPESVEFIGSATFKGCQHLETITIHQGVNGIGEMAFADSPNLQEIHLRNEHPENLFIQKFRLGHAYATFADLKSCTLFVPVGTGYAYRHDERIKDMFKEIKIER